MQISLNCRIRCNYFFRDTFVTFMSYGPPKDFIIKYHEDGFGMTKMMMMMMMMIMMMIMMMAIFVKL